MAAGDGSFLQAEEFFTRGDPRFVETLRKVRDGKALVLDFRGELCAGCGVCVEACPCDAIRMDTQKSETAEYDRASCVVDLNYLVNNHPENKSPYSIALY